MNWRHYLKWGMFILVAIVAFVWLIVNIAKATELPRFDVVADVTDPAATINGTSRFVSAQKLASFDVAATTDSVTVKFPIVGNETLFSILTHASSTYDMSLTFPTGESTIYQQFFPSAPATYKVVKPDSPVYFVLHGRVSGTFWDGTKNFFQHWHEYFPSEGVVTVEMDPVLTDLGALLKFEFPYPANVADIRVYDGLGYGLPFWQWPGGALVYQNTFSSPETPGTYTQFPDQHYGYAVLTGARGVFGASSVYHCLIQIHNGPS